MDRNKITNWTFGILPLVWDYIRPNNSTPSVLRPLERRKGNTNDFSPVFKCLCFPERWEEGWKGGLLSDIKEGTLEVVESLPWPPRLLRKDKRTETSDADETEQ